MAGGQIDENGMSSLDADQVIRSSATILADGTLAQKIAIVSGSGLVNKEYDEIDLTYVVSGDGAGEIETVTYLLDGDVVSTLTMTYDGSNRLSTVTRS